MCTNYSSSEGSASRAVPKHANLEEAMGLILDRAKHLVNQLVEDRGHDKPPFLPEEYARLQGIKKIVRTSLGEVSAVLLRFGDGHVIKVNQNHNMARQNFSCAHEIGHNLLRELKIGLNTENIEYRTYDPQAPGRIVAKARERLCDAAAAELLMPELVFGKYLSGFGVSIHSVEQLARIFRVSIQAAAFRIAKVSTEPCIALLWQPWPKNRPKGLRLAPIRSLTGKGRYLPLHTYVRNSSALYRAYESDRLIKSFKIFKFLNTVKRLSMESKGFGHDETRYIISLAFIDR